MFMRQVFVVSSYKAGARKTVKPLRRENSALTYSGDKCLSCSRHFLHIFLPTSTHLKAPIFQRTPGIHFRVRKWQRWYLNPSPLSAHHLRCESLCSFNSLCGCFGGSPAGQRFEESGAAVGLKTMEIRRKGKSQSWF